MKKVWHALKKVVAAKAIVSGAGKAVVAFAAGAAFLVNNISHAIHEKTAGIGDRFHKKEVNNSEEGIFMRKSTMVTLLVAFAAIAGVLGALYVYVLRREKELDEYEKLLFSEDFGDAFDDEMVDEPVLDEVPAEVPAEV